ncbi:MAG: EF-hand domain-containing protein [Paracoccaceae bacterium]|nr:MAG: EF-hand domain-containing protein [Paracoccaceae bacterium]
MTLSRKFVMVAPAVLAAAFGLSVAGSALADRDGPRMGGHGMERGAGPMFDFDTLDADGDGRVTRDEMNAARTARVAALDADGDGRISRDELKAAQMRESEARADRMADRMMQMMDADGDGFLSAAEMMVRPAPAMLFDRIDTDGDGAISKAEADAARARFAERSGRRGDHRGHERRPQANPEN